MSEHNEWVPSAEDERSIRISNNIETVRIASDSDNETLASSSRTIKKQFKVSRHARPALLVALALAVTACVAFVAAPGGGSAAPHGGQRATVGPVRKLLESPDLTELLVVQARNNDPNAQSLSEAQLQSAVRNIVDDFGTLVDDHLDSRSREALEGANLDRSIFADLRKMFYIIHDTRLVQLGQHAYKVLSNASTTPQDVQRVLSGNLGLNQSQITALQSEIPSEFLDALRAQRGHRDEINFGFSPAAVDHMRQPGQSREKAEWSVRVRTLMPDFHPHNGALRSEGSSGRRLADAAGLTVGVVGVCVVALVQIFIQLQVFVKDFSMPVWLWCLFVVPEVGVGATECGMHGLYGSLGGVLCDVFLGSIAFNALEWIFFGFDR